MPTTAIPTGFNSWKPADDQSDSDHEDVETVMSRRRKAKGKLKINENRTRVGNKRISKNIIDVLLENVALNIDEENAKWKFVADQRIVICCRENIVRCDQEECRHYMHTGRCRSHANC
ncbi:hypothetical protein LIER_23716 [Lithospermum erythrorhizon]|uniref:C3H1-type domain-containing protein n=1 Tax=Lithospermum erythrorhizon TaxID=34254 RepID=A0AAV3R2N4_LITER